MSFELLSFTANLLGIFLSFMLVALCLEILMHLLPIKRHRLRAILRMMPFFTLILDFTCFNLKIGHFFNPLCCNSCWQKLLLQALPELKSYLSVHNITLLEYVAIGRTSPLAFALKVALYTLSIAALTRTLGQAYCSKAALFTLIRQAQPCQRSVENCLLKKHLMKYALQVYTSHAICIPFATYQGQIFLPVQVVAEMDQEGFESIIAHELEHIRWQDPLFRFILEVTSAFFWYVPTYLWLRKFEQEQEMACDKGILEYGLAAESFAKAFLSTAKRLKYANKECAWQSLLTKDSFSMRRLNLILGIEEKARFPLPTLISAVIGTGVWLICLMT